MCFVSHIRFVKFKILVGIRLGIMFGNSFGLPNLLTRTNKPRLLPAFQNFVNMLSFDGVICYNKHIIFYENIEYCKIRSYDFEYVIFSYTHVCFISLLLLF